MYSLWEIHFLVLFRSFDYSIIIFSRFHFHMHDQIFVKLSSFKIQFRNSFDHSIIIFFADLCFLSFCFVSSLSSPLKENSSLFFLLFIKTHSLIIHIVLHRNGELLSKRSSLLCSLCVVLFKKSIIFSHIDVFFFC